jgi:hypothetical protein
MLMYISLMISAMGMQQVPLQHIKGSSHAAEFQVTFHRLRASGMILSTFTLEYSSEANICDMAESSLYHTTQGYLHTLLLLAYRCCRIKF